MCTALMLPARTAPASEPSTSSCSTLRSLTCCSGICHRHRLFVWRRLRHRKRHRLSCCNGAQPAGCLLPIALRTALIAAVWRACSACGCVVCMLRVQVVTAGQACFHQVGSTLPHAATLSLICRPMPARSTRCAGPPAWPRLTLPPMHPPPAARPSPRLRRSPQLSLLAGRRVPQLRLRHRHRAAAAAGPGVHERRC